MARRLSKKKKKKLIKLFILIIIALCYYFLNNYSNQISNEINYKKVEVTTDNKLRVYFIDVGQAEAILLSENNHNMLIDAGNRKDGIKLVNYIKSLGIDHFDYVIGTHAHEDHIGGMYQIINNFNIDRYYMPDVSVDDFTYNNLISNLEKNNLDINIPVVGDNLVLENTSCKVLYVGTDTVEINNDSIILKCVFFNNSYLFTADATNEVEYILVNGEYGDYLKSDVLKISHHGSRYSNSAVFLNKVKPDYAVISVGRDNDYNLPAEITLNKLNYLNLRLYRTDIDGTIISTSDGNNISFETVATDTNG